jgi:hypothetical protein
MCVASSCDWFGNYLKYFVNEPGPFMMCIMSPEWWVSGPGMADARRCFTRAVDAPGSFPWARWGRVLSGGVLLFGLAMMNADFFHSNHEVGNIH